MTADEVAILASQLTALEGEVDGMRAEQAELRAEVAAAKAEVQAARVDVAAIHRLLIEERAAETAARGRLREACVELVTRVVDAYIRPEGPSRGLMALTVAVLLTMLLVAGTVTIGDFEPLLAWWAGDQPAQESLP